VTYLFIVEDTIHEVIGILVNRVFEEENLLNPPRRKFEPHPRGHLTNSDKLKRIIKSHDTKDPNIEKIFIMWDSETDTFENGKEYLELKLRTLTEEDPRVIPCVIARALESWLLYDDIYLVKIFKKSNYHLNGDIELSSKFENPKKFIRTEFKKWTGKYFNMKTHGRKIAENMDLRKLESSRSFSFFKEKLISD